jgi:hypothetical protein
MSRLHHSRLASLWSLYGEISAVIMVANEYGSWERCGALKGEPAAMAEMVRK